MLSTVLLVSHGSRDRRPQLAVDKLAQQLSDRLKVTQGGDSLTDSLVGSAVLELGPTPLSAQIHQFAEYSLSLGIHRVQILPLFLLPGVHVGEDIPTEVELAQKSLGTEIEIHLQPYLGSQRQQLSVLLENVMIGYDVDAWILLSHGSRRAGGNEAIAHLAHKINASVAYWSVAPGMESRVQELLQAGYHRIGILPYFLFSGRTTDAIVDLVANLGDRFPHSQLHLTPPLDHSPHLGDLICTWAESCL
ncbi:MAG: sirohydrochlorin chelatase [Limnospira sp. PMC 1238.20]|uniref:sirohydrochlorin chelatase n=1 Tax=Limnospira sp. PMC 1238.20 TaxID=2981036 RepID=UPI000D3A2FD0|nr:sirohydrochlorin chelatase [Limnospira sp. PMC 1238.20]MDT9176789.1 sirohydrochlorin chelatase [Limnospira sp. PMC 1238.20]MDT9176790.1 sirohydrochlorin chelatase [Limnospira sp. PMC 1238.20]